MIELLSLEFNNIGRFTSSQKISFENRDKLIQVDGSNKNTGGSSGSGKTTVFLALDYLLGINDIPSTVLQSRLTKNPIEVSGRFIVDKKQVVISRSKKNGLTIKIDNDTISGNVKLAEEKLDELIGVPRKIFKKMVHKRQKQGGFFLSLTAKEMYQFLIQMLGLNDYLDKVDRISEHVKFLNELIIEKNNKIDKNEGIIAQLENILKDKKAPYCHLTEEEVLKIQEKITNIKEILVLKNESKISTIYQIEKPTKKESNIESKIPELEKELIDLNKYKDSLLNEKNTKISNIKEAIRNIESDLTEVFKNKEYLETIKISLKDLNNKKKHIESNECHTCKQKWTGDGAKQEIININNLIGIKAEEALMCKSKIDLENDLIIKIEKAKEIMLKIENSDITSEINDKISKSQNLLVEEKSRITGHIANINNEYLQAQLDYKNLVEEKSKLLDIEINDMKDILNSLNLEYMEKSSSLNSYRESLIRHNKEVEELKLTISRQNTILKKFQEHSQKCKNTLLVAEEAKRCIKTYTLQIFQETLDTIGESASDMLSGIPNMSNSTIYFEGCKENKDGSIKDEVNAVINMEGIDKIPLKSLSGGEETAIELAVDLAVIDVIETKANKGANFYITDEPFDGLDSICKENCLHILSRSNTNKKIIMVDHSSELKEQVSDIITVTRDGEFSQVI